MKRWDLRSLAPSSTKLNARAPGAGAPRVPMMTGRQMPRVLFSYPECRAVVVDLQSGEELGDHHVRERAVLEVIAGRVSIATEEETVECKAGMLVTFDPGEHHTVGALDDAQLLLLLAPWPSANHNTEPGEEHRQHLPANALAEPIPALETTSDQTA